MVARWQYSFKPERNGYRKHHRRRRWLQIITTEEDWWKSRRKLAAGICHCGSWLKSYAAGKKAGHIRHFLIDTFPTFDNMEKQLHLNLLASRPPMAGGLQYGSKMKMGWELASTVHCPRLFVFVSVSLFLFSFLPFVFIITVIISSLGSCGKGKEWAQVKSKPCLSF